MTESEAIATIKRLDSPVYDLDKAARLILGKYLALKESHKAASAILKETQEKLRRWNDA